MEPTLFNLEDYTLTRSGASFVFTPKPPKPPQPLPPLCSTAQAAKFLGISQDTAKSLCQDGKLPARKKTCNPRGPWVIARAALIAYRRKRHQKTCNTTD